MLFLTEKEMKQALNPSEMISAMEEAFRIQKMEESITMKRFFAEEHGDKLIYMPCMTPKYVCTKILTEYPGNTAKGIPLLHGIMAVNNRETGEFAAIMNGSCITALRTGAVGAVGAKYLSRQDCHSAGLIGCGVQGWHQLFFLCTVREIRDIYLLPHNGRNMDQFISSLKEALNQPICFHILEDVESLIQQSEILISATPSVNPLYPDSPELLAGKCYIAIGSWQPHQRELPDTLCEILTRMIIEFPHEIYETGDLVIPIKKGILTEDRINYMMNIITDQEFSIQDGETTCFKSVGMSLYDMVMAQKIYEKASLMGLGTEINEISG